MWKTLAKKTIWSLAILVLLLPGAGCRRSRGGSYTSFGVGGYVPAFVGGGGFYDTVVEEGYYIDDSYDAGYYEGDYYSDYYDSGYSDEYYYGDDWKAKRPGKTKR